MFPALFVLSCTILSVAATSGCDCEPAPPFDLLEEAYKVLQHKEARTCDDATQIKQALENIMERLGQIEAVISEDRNTRTTEHEEIAQKMDSLESMVNTVTTGTSDIRDKVDTIKTRQQASLSEVRLISLFKLTGEDFQLGHGYNPGLVVDGQYVFSSHHESSMRTNSYSGSGKSKIWIDLGGLFRVYSVRVWNRRDTSKRYFDGTKIYVGDDTRIGELIGTASGVLDFYDFTLSEDDVKYGSRVTLLPHTLPISVLEVQVWGNGPYNSSDKFN